MMGQIPSNVREGLLEVFYGVYQKNAQRVLDALVVMGVLVPGMPLSTYRKCFVLKWFTKSCLLF